MRGLRVGAIAALAMSLTAQPALVVAASSTELTAGARVVPAAHRMAYGPGTAVSGLEATASLLVNGRLRLQVRTSARSVGIRYLIAGGSSRSMTVRVRGGAARVTLPASATSIRVRRAATSTRRATAWVRVPIAPSSPLDQPPSAGTIAAWEAELLGLVNAVRASGHTCPGGELHAPAAALVRNPALDGAARGHSSWMAEVGRLSHQGRGGSSLGARLSASGYDWHRAAENVAAGQPRPAEVLDQWLGSAGHCRELMNPSNVETGIGYAYSTISVYRHFWTQDFATS